MYMASDYFKNNTENENALHLLFLERTENPSKRISSVENGTWQAASQTVLSPEKPGGALSAASTLQGLDSSSLISGTGLPGLAIK
jgi:hypothetical protein